MASKNGKENIKKALSKEAREKAYLTSFNKSLDAMLGKTYGGLIVEKATSERTKDRTIIWECFCTVCQTGGHKFETTAIKNNLVSCGCSRMSKPEAYIKKILENNNLFLVKKKLLKLVVLKILIDMLDLIFM